MKKVVRIIPIIAVILLISLLIIFPSYASNLALEGFSVWFLYVLPSLFPFFFLSGIISNLNLSDVFEKKFSKLTERTFGLSGITSYAAILSYISGYPIGAKITENLYKIGYISKDDVTCCALLSSTSGIIFIIGTIGGIIIKNIFFGIIIYLSHIFGAIITAKIFAPKKATDINTKKHLPINANKTLYELMYDSVISIIIVGGYISLFYVFYGIVEKTRVLSPITRLLDLMLSPFGKDLGADILSGLFECTQGIKKISAKVNDKKIASIISCFLISFGGLSINLQNLSFLSNTGINKTTYLIGKVVHAIIATAISSIVFIII